MIGELVSIDRVALFEEPPIQRNSQTYFFDSKAININNLEKYNLIGVVIDQAFDFVAVRVITSEGQIGWFFSNYVPDSLDIV